MYIYYSGDQTKIFTNELLLIKFLREKYPTENIMEFVKHKYFAVFEAELCDIVKLLGMNNKV